MYSSLIPADQKWQASVGGELSNSATYISTYANVSLSNYRIMGGSIGDETCTWQPWSYEKRLEIAEQVQQFKQSIIYQIVVQKLREQK